MRYNLPALNCYSQTNYTPTADSFIEPAVVIFGFLGLSLVRQSLVFVIRPIAPLLAICRLGCPAASVNTAKRFEADVAPVFGVCEKAQWQARLYLAESLCKTCATEIKEHARHQSQPVIVEREQIEHQTNPQSL